MIKNKKITRDISAGMYVLSTDRAGCMVDTVMQVSSGEPALISVAVNKNNYTNEVIREHKMFGISILGMNVNPDIIKTFGFQSSRDVDKFKDIDYITVDGIKIIKEAIGYMVCELVDMVDADTHTIFIGKMISADKFNNEKPMTYGYYQENKEDLLKLTTEKGKNYYICTVCGYRYYGDDLPDNFKCPICGVENDMFVKNG